MCGIVGIASKNLIERREWLVSGRDAIKHRGPDDLGEWWSEDGRVGLAHRRLSIIDLSPDGKQPMSDISGKFRIIFNGEIYNYLDLKSELHALGVNLYSKTDTEVILECYKKWGVDCLSRLNGMFVFAIVDLIKQTVLLARDRAGEKPLFYRYTETELRFASELKALLTDTDVPRQIETEALDCYLAFGYIPGGRCILRGFNKLEPANAMIFNLNTGKLKKWAYWNLPEFDTNVSYNADLMVDEIENLLGDAVKRQLVADVPVGILLSGGLDSSLVTAMATKASKKVKTFTVSLPGYGKLDETQHARLIANFFKTEHIDLAIQPTSAEILPHLARQFDEPIVDSSMIPTFLISQLVRQHCAVVLGGDGGDELFGGYEHYSRLLWLNNKLGKIPIGFRKLLSRTAIACLPLGFKGRNWLEGLGEDLQHGLPIVASYFDVKTRKNLLKSSIHLGLAAQIILTERIPKEKDLLQRALRMDYQNYLPEDILVKVDRASMLNSLEVRAPFLDYRIIEFAFKNVPTACKVKGNTKKILLKDLANRILPPEFDKKRKQGFSIPLATWLKSGTFRTLFYDVLLNENSVFDRKVTSNLLKNQENGYANSERLFSLVFFDLWCQTYKIRI